MSLEAALQENTAALRELATIMRSGATPNAASTEEPARRGRKSAKAETTRWFHIPKHNTVAEIKPGEPIPTIESTEEIDEATYKQLKEKYAPQSATAGAAASPAPAPQEQAAAPAPAAQATTSGAGTVSFAQLRDKLGALLRGGAEGPAKVQAIFAKYGVKAFPELEGKADYAAVAADVDAASQPAAADLGL